MTLAAASVIIRDLFNSHALLYTLYIHFTTLGVVDEPFN
jgi:hypothetical protein